MASLTEHNCPAQRSVRSKMMRLLRTNILNWIRYKLDLQPYNATQQDEKYILSKN